MLPMRQMTRPEFDAYEKRVESALASMEQSLDESERLNFEEIAAAAREVIGIRREHVELSERQQLDEAEKRGITPDYVFVDDEEAARFGIQDAAIAHGAFTLLMGISQELEFARREDRDTAELEREMSDAIRIAGELGASGNQSLRADSDRWPQLRDAIRAAEARQVIDELATARQMVDDARREMIDTDLADERLETALSKGMELALNGNQHIRDYAERDPQLKNWIDRGQKEATDHVSALSFDADRPRGEPEAAQNEHRGTDTPGSGGHARQEAEQVLAVITEARNQLGAKPEGELSGPESIAKQIELEGHELRLDSALWKAAGLVVNDGNQFLRDVAANDQVLHDRIAYLERGDVSLRAGRDGMPMPDVAKGDPEMLDVYELGLATFRSDLAKESSRDVAYGHVVEPPAKAWAELGQLERALQAEREQLAGGSRNGNTQQTGMGLGYVSLGATDGDDRFNEVVLRHGEQPVRDGNRILADLDVADASYSYASHQISRAGWGFVRERTTDEYRDVVATLYRNTLEQFEGAIARYARAALDGNTYLYDISKRDESLYRAIDEEVGRREFRYPHLRFGDDHPSARHGDDAVRSARDLFAEIDAASSAVRSLSEVREGRDSGPYDGGRSQPEQGARTVSLEEAESSHAALLRHAARDALDGNSYLLEMRKIRHDLNNEIHLESRRRDEAGMERIAGDQGLSLHSGQTDQSKKSIDEYRADPPPQQPLLRQIELALKERQDREHDSRDR